MGGRIQELEQGLVAPKMRSQLQPSRRRPRKVIALTFLSLALLAAPKKAFAAQDVSPWEHVLREFVTDAGRVDYSALAAHPGELDRFVGSLRARSPLSDPAGFPTRAARLAYWINAYNALAIAGVVQAWPVSSVRQIGFLPFSFFHKKFVVGGRRMTLDEIEGILRQRPAPTGTGQADPRIHFAIVCASLSCPRLAREAYTPEKVEGQLDRAAREFISDPRNVSIDVAHNRVKLSRIFRWYRGDFAAAVGKQDLPGEGDPVLRYIRRYAAPAMRRALDALPHPRIDYFPYDWEINAVAPPKS
jgi:Protein of unknown function, DUF547